MTFYEWWSRVSDNKARTGKMYKAIAPDLKELCHAAFDAGRENMMEEMIAFAIQRQTQSSTKQ